MNASADLSNVSSGRSTRPWHVLVLLAFFPTLALAQASPQQQMNAARAELDAAERSATKLPADSAKDTAVATSLNTAADRATTFVADASKFAPSSRAEVIQRAEALRTIARTIPQWRLCDAGLAVVERLQAVNKPAARDEVLVVVQTCAEVKNKLIRTPAQDTTSALHRRAEDAKTARDRSERAAAAAGEEQARLDEVRRIEQTTVRGRFPEFTEADGFDPQKIAEAFAKAPKEIVYHAPTSIGAQLELAKGVRVTCASREGKKVAFAGWNHNGASSGVEMFDAGPWDTHGMPLLIWERKGNYGDYVSLDGLHYYSEHLDQLVQGVPPRNAWPTAVGRTCLPELYFERLEQAGVIPAGTRTSIEPAKKAVQACVSKVWKGSQREIDANERANITHSTRENRYSAILDRTTSKVERTCESQRRTYEEAMLRAIDTRAKPRRAALATATAALSGK